MINHLKHLTDVTKKVDKKIDEIGEHFCLYQDTIHFNKEQIYAGFFAILGAPIFGYLMSLFTTTPTIISASAMVGGVIGSSTCWLLLRVKYGNIRGDFSGKKLTRDIMCYTPAATVIGLITDHPILFFLSWFLLDMGMWVIPATIIAQVVAFTTYLTGINMYRVLLEKYTGRRL